MNTLMKKMIIQKNKKSNISIIVAILLIIIFISVIVISIGETNTTIESINKAINSSSGGEHYGEFIKIYRK